MTQTRGHKIYSFLGCHEKVSVKNDLDFYRLSNEVGAATKKQHYTIFKKCSNQISKNNLKVVSEPGQIFALEDMFPHLTFESWRSCKHNKIN